MNDVLIVLSAALLLCGEPPSDIRLPSSSQAEFRLPKAEAPRDPVRLPDGMLVGEERGGAAYGFGTFRARRARVSPAVRGVRRDRLPRGGVGIMVRWSF